MPVALSPVRQALRDEIARAVAAGLPVEAQQHPITLYRAGGANALIHSDSRRCATTARRLSAGVQPFVTTLAALPRERSLCTCATELRKFGDVGELTVAMSRLGELRELLADLRTAPEPHRWVRWVQAAALADKLAGTAEHLDNEVFIAAHTVELEALAGVDRTVVDTWRAAPSSHEATVWWSATLLWARSSGPKKKFLDRVVAGEHVASLTELASTPAEFDRWTGELRVAPGEFVTALVWAGSVGGDRMFSVAEAQWGLAARTGSSSRQMVVRCPRWVFGALDASKFRHARLLPSEVDVRAASFILEMAGDLPYRSADVEGLDGIVDCAVVASAA